MESLYGDLQRLLYSDPQVFNRMIRTSATRARFGYDNPRLLQSFCDQDIRLSEIQRHAPAFLETHGEIYLFKFPPTPLTEGDVMGHATISYIDDQYVIGRDQTIYEDRAFHDMGYQSVNMPGRSLSEVIAINYQEGFTRVEPNLQYVIYGQRTSCVQRIPNYADQSVLRIFQADIYRLRQLSEQLLKIPRSWRILFGYLLFVASTLATTSLVHRPDVDDLDEVDNATFYEINLASIPMIEEKLLSGWQ